MLSAGGPTSRPAAGALTRDIDALYQQPLASFTSARNNLARTLTQSGARDQAARVKALAKPAVVPWAVNQVYWQSRSIWDRLLEAGEAVRAAQIAALEQSASTPAQAERRRDAVRDATVAHRKAVADAVHQAVRLAGQADTNPNPDHLTRMLEALSLAASPPAEPGRLTALIQLAGFEALFGVTPAPGASVPRPVTGPPASVTTLRPKDKARAERAQAEAASAHHARVVAATDALAGARAAAQAAENAERRASDAVADAELRVTQAKAELRTAQSASRAAASVRDAAERALARLTPDA